VVLVLACATLASAENPERRPILQKADDVIKRVQELSPATFA
jgi:hypothetical protein